MRNTRVVLLAAFVAGCQSDDRRGNIHVDENDHVSFAVPDGFHLTRERGTWVLVGENERAGATIAIRSVPRAGWSEDRSPDMLRPLMESALRAYPGASVRGPTALDDAPYPGFAFDITYQPRREESATAAGTPRWSARTASSTSSRPGRPASGSTLARTSSASF
jgi:hypothetical protein